MALTTEDFIEKAKAIHGNKYDYSKVEYKNNKTKVCIICPKHGEFWQMPANHIHRILMQGCPICKKEKLSLEKLLDKKEVLDRFLKTHGDDYDYSKMIFKGLNAKIEIKCNKCGYVFSQRANSHLRGRGCPKCAGKLIDNKQFIDDAKEVHGNKYDYSKVSYQNAKDKVCIICPKHDEFWQNRDKHIKCKQGCPKCQESHLESQIRCFLEENNINFEYQKRFKWLGKQSLDFYLPDHNIAIECQGEQHFQIVDFGFKDKKKAEENFIKIKENDRKKLMLCKEHNVEMIYFLKHSSIRTIEKLLKNKK